MSRERSLATAFVQLADSLVEDFDTTELLQVLVDQMVDLVGVDAAGLLLDDKRGNLQVVSSTDHHDRSLELFELQARSGPGIDAFTAAQPVVNIGLDEARRRWPDFATAAAGAGYQIAHALPMRLRDQVVGALCLVHDSGTLSEEDQVIA
ncbi:MAG: GAF domain-containing protein, partial [Nocardioides sp.]|nr:GAF domain-containing protein [Nocardioides sp.]